MQLQRYIDHTLLRPDATAQEIERLVEEAKTYGFWSVCVSPNRIPQARACIGEGDVQVTTVIGFPHGADTTEAKVFAVADALRLGADEIDYVHPVGWIRDGQWDALRLEYREMRRASHGKILKVILETALLTEEDIIRACRLAVEEGFDFVKTSTGYAARGASLEDIHLMKKAVGTQARIKASGGIRTYAQAMAMIQAGATRLGLSRSVAIVQEGEQA